MRSRTVLAGLVVHAGRSWLRGVPTHTVPPGAGPKDANYDCIAASSHTLDLPPSRPPVAQPGVAEIKPVCPAGQVPMPKGIDAPKGMPGLHPPRIAAPVYYFYVNDYQYVTSVGTFASLSQHAPYLDPVDYHSLAEITVESSDLKQIVEVGWTVDRAVNGDTNPHLFVYHWVNGAGTCYNGCGWQQVSTTRHPGMTVAVTTTPQAYWIEQWQGNWWISYQNDWIGYFPGTLWDGVYKQGGLTQWFGEVSASTTSPATDMGNGIFGSQAGSAVVQDLWNLNTDYQWVAAAASSNATHPNYYNNGALQPTSFRYGGPGR